MFYFHYKSVNLTLHYISARAFIFQLEYNDVSTVVAYVIMTILFSFTSCLVTFRMIYE